MRFSENQKSEIRIPKFCSGFTLVEIMLVLVLLVALAAAGALSLFALRQESRFNDEVFRLESALRMARAEAARTGFRIRLVPDADAGTLTILWEPQPLEAPEQFVPFTGATWGEMAQLDYLRLTRCELTSAAPLISLPPGATDQTSGSPPSALVASQPAAGASSDQAPMQTLTFFPDGSADSAEIELVSRDPTDTRHAIVDLSPLGHITAQILSDLEYQDWQQAKQSAGQ